MQDISITRLLSNIFFYFAIISFTEELVFRGYLQTRIYGIIKSDFRAVVFVGFLCAIFHAPFRMITIEIGFLESLGGISGIFRFIIIHALINALYRKYNTLLGPIVLHGFMNLTI